MRRLLSIAVSSAAFVAIRKTMRAAYIGSLRLQRQVAAHHFFSLVACSGFALTVAAPQSVSAQAVNELAIHGPAQYCPPDGPCQDVTWTGTVTIATSSGASGVYSGDTFLSLSVDAGFFTATSDGLNFDNGVPVPGDFASVTLSNGSVTSFDFTYANQPNFEIAIFRGLSGFYSRSGAPDGLTITAFTVTTGIPEPEVLFLMLAGLPVTGLAVRSRERKATSPVVNL